MAVLTRPQGQPLLHSQLENDRVHDLLENDRVNHDPLGNDKVNHNQLGNDGVNRESNVRDSVVRQPPLFRGVGGMLSCRQVLAYPATAWHPSEEGTRGCGPHSTTSTGHYRPTGKKRDKPPQHN